MNMQRKIEISFENLSYWTKDGKHIIKSINGEFGGGKLIGILGPSGAGKTTLLNLLSGFISTGYQGTILVNKVARKISDLKKISRFITQEDDLHGLLTVEENIKFAADLQLGNDIDKDTKKLKINDILTKFGLEKIKTNRTSKLSNGERKRLAICLELISDPLVIFSDEPTSGLDTVSSNSCINFLKDLAKLGKTVVCTVHQPSTTIFNCFDHVFIMADGNCIYEGLPLNIINFLDSNGLKCNIHHNPADFAIEIASGEYGSKQIGKLVDALKIRQQEVRLKYHGSFEENIPRGKVINCSFFKNNLFEINTLAKRELIKLRRNFIMIHLRISAQLIIAIFVSALFGDIGMDASKLWSNVNLVVLIVGCITWIQTYANALSFPSEVPILKKEYFNGYFSFVNYYFVTFLWDVIFSIIVTTMMSSIYFLTGQPNELFRIVMFLTISFLCAMNGQSIGLLTGGIRKIEIGIFATTYMNAILIAISGFCIVFKDIPPYFAWIPYISFLRYGITGLATSIYGYDRDKLMCYDENGCVFNDPTRALKDFGIEGNTFFRDFSVLVVNYLIVKYLAYIYLKRRLRTSIR